MTELIAPQQHIRSQHSVQLPHKKTVSFLGFPREPMNEPQGRELRDRIKLAEQKAERMATQETTMSFVLGSGSKWKQSHLIRLGVDFKMNEEFDLCKVVFDPKTALEWGHTHANKIIDAVKQLQFYEMSEVMKLRHIPNFTDGARWFVGTFRALREVMTEMESHPSSRPNTSDSGGSAASKHEDNIRLLCLVLLQDFLQASGNSLQYIPWDRDNLIFDASGQISKKFKLGQENVAVANDGAILLKRYHDRGSKGWKPIKGMPPILSLEVKRKDHLGNKLESRRYGYAAQVFAEMLAQIMPDDWLDNPNLDTQEAFVIHGRHVCFSIYYCRFPVSYLRNLAQYGAEYSQYNDEKVTLWRTKPYYLSVTDQRVDFFLLFARLIHYLGSGKAEIRYLQKEIIDCLYPIESMRDRSSSSEDEIMLDSITVESPSQLGLWETDLEDRIYPVPTR